MIDPVDRAVRAIARRNSIALVWAQFAVVHLIMLGGLGLLSLYQPMSLGTFLVLVAVSQTLVLVENVVSIGVTRRMWKPVRAWENGQRDPESTIAAWKALATLPLEYLRQMRKYPLTFSYLPFIAFATWELSLPWYSLFILAAVGTVVLAYGLIVRYFTMEVVVRPVLEQVATDLPDEFTAADSPGLPLRWRLLAVAPVINVITGVVVAGLSAHGHQATLADLGISWLIAVAVSFTISLELVVLVVRTLFTTMNDLRNATEKIRAGDYSARVPVVATDETGALARSFNMMAEGLKERQRLRSAFGAYVDPDVAERVIKEGADLAGEELEVTILFLDIRGFTELAGRRDPVEVVAMLNDLWSVVVPILRKHGGQANKFIGDGLLAVFGAPDPQDDHPLLAVRAALQIAREVHEHFDGQLGVGIGVNTGDVLAGTVGGGGRIEFTVIGDPVNVASRVEAATRETGDDVLITEATKSRLPADECEFDMREDVELKGIPLEMDLYAPRAKARQSVSADGAAPSRASAASRAAG
jgi:class 3 adenylate cyclase